MPCRRERTSRGNAGCELYVRAWCSVGSGGLQRATRSVYPTTAKRRNLSAGLRTVHAHAHASTNCFLFLFYFLFIVSFLPLIFFFFLPSFKYMQAPSLTMMTTQTNAWHYQRSTAASSTGTAVRLVLHGTTLAMTIISWSANPTSFVAKTSNGRQQSHVVYQQ